MKKFILSAAAAALCASTVFASEITVTLNGENVEFASQPPVIEDGRTLIPLRGVFEKLGFQISWYGGTKTASFIKDDTLIEITAGSNEMTVNGAAAPLDVPAQIINGSMMLPLRAVGEAAGLDVDWDNDAKTVILSENAEPSTETTSEAAAPVQVDYGEIDSVLNNSFFALLCSNMYMTYQKAESDDSWVNYTLEIEGEDYSDLLKITSNANIASNFHNEMDERLPDDYDNNASYDTYADFFTKVFDAYSVPIMGAESEDAANKIFSDSDEARKKANKAVENDKTYVQNSLREYEKQLNTGSKELKEYKDSVLAVLVKYDEELIAIGNMTMDDKYFSAIADYTAKIRDDVSAIPVPQDAQAYAYILEAALDYKDKSAEKMRIAMSDEDNPWQYYLNISDGITNSLYYDVVCDAFFDYDYEL